MQQLSRGGGGGYSHTLTIRVCAAGQGMVFQAFEFRTWYINQENNVGNRVYNYIKLINSLIQVAINFLERHMDRHRIRVILFWVSSLEQGIKTKLNLI